jgi:hypothetical protein
VAHGAAADERLGHAVDADRAEHTCRLAHRLHRFLKRDGVEHCGEHSHVVGGRAGDVPVLGKRRAADEIPAPHDNPQLHTHLGDINALAGDVFQLSGFDPETSLVAKSFAADLQEHALVGRSLWHERRL